MNKLVSVIIPTWNSAAYIQETVQSVINQTYPNIEIILVDNASKDATIEKINELNCDRIKIIQLPENKGASFARKVGFEQSKGQYIQYLDGDDLLSINKIRNQVLYLEERPLHLAFGDVAFFWDGEDPWIKIAEPNASFYFSSDEPLSFLLNLYGLNGRAGMIPIHSWLSPREVLELSGPWNEGLTVDDDGEYFCRAILASKGLIFVSDTIVFYRKFKTRKSLSREQSHAAMRSLFISIDSKYQVCQKYSQSTEDVRTVFAIHYMEFADITWPEFPDLTRIALGRVKALGGTKHVPLIGNPLLNKLKYVFGWRAMKWVSKKKNQLFSKR
jgi:glycosyltransferase involved in cell wall biosynthesis